MTVLICNDVPPVLRGHRKVMDFILRNAPADFGVMVVTSAPNCQGYTVERIGPSHSSLKAGWVRKIVYFKSEPRVVVPNCANLTHGGKALIP